MTTKNCVSKHTSRQKGFQKYFPKDTEAGKNCRRRCKGPEAFWERFGMNKKYIHKERYLGTTSRSFSFSDIDEENIKAEFKDGTLLLTIPKKEKVDNKKVINID